MVLDPDTGSRTFRFSHFFGNPSLDYLCRRGTYRHRGDLEQLASKGKIFGMKSEMLEGRLFVALEGVMQACRLGTLESRPEFTDDALTTLFFRDKKFFNADIIDI